MRASSTFTGILCAAAVLGFAAVAPAQDTDPRVGQWRNKDNPTNVMTYEAVPGGGIKVIVEGVNREGQKTQWGYTTMLDGKDAVITGDPNRETASVTRTDRLTNEIVYKKGGKPSQLATNTVSADGNTLTVTFRTPEGEQTAVAVYERIR